MPYDGPSLSEWLAEFRSRRDPVQVILHEADLPDPVPDGVAGRKPVASLKIVRYDEPDNPRPTGGFYLLALDESGDWVTDYWGKELEDVFDQAAFSFGIERNAWRSFASEG